MLYGSALSNSNCPGQRVNFDIAFQYPSTNPLLFEGEEQPVIPPIELASVEFRLTDNRLCLLDILDPFITWHRRIHKTTDEPTADLINGVYVGKLDKANIKGLPVARTWFFQARSWGRNEVCSDWTPIYSINDDPPEIPTPEITSIQTNENNQVKLEWTDVSGFIPNFSHYEVIYTIKDTSNRVKTGQVLLNTDAIIVNQG